MYRIKAQIFPATLKPAEKTEELKNTSYIEGHKGNSKN